NHAYFLDTGLEPFHQIATFKMMQHGFSSLLPELIAYLLMNTFIPEECVLAVLGSHINQYRIAVCGAIHFMCLKYLPGTLQGIGIRATMFNIDSDFTGCIPLGLLNSGYQAFLLPLCKKITFQQPRHDAGFKIAPVEPFRPRARPENSLFL